MSLRPFCSASCIGAWKKRRDGDCGGFISSRAMARSCIAWRVAWPPDGITTSSAAICLARAKPGVLNYGSLGPATTANLLLGWLKKQEDVDMTHIVYKGPPDLFRADLGGVELSNRQQPRLERARSTPREGSARGGP